MRNRKLYLAALEVIRDNKRVIDIAYNYGYDTPESFTKAFTRFHGVSPVQIKSKPEVMNAFQPLDITLSIKGGDKLDFTIENMNSFNLIGLGSYFHYDRAFEDIPEFWNLYNEKYARKYCNILTEKSSEVYGISIDEEMAGERFKYLIAGSYEGPIYNDIKELEVIIIPSLTWAKFKCIGPMPEAFKSLYTRIFNEWLPRNSEYEIALGYNIEVY